MTASAAWVDGVFAVGDRVNTRFVPGVAGMVGRIEASGAIWVYWPDGPGRDVHWRAADLRHEPAGVEIDDAMVEQAARIRLEAACRADAFQWARAVRTADLRTILASHAELIEVLERARSLLEDEDRMHPIGCSAWRESAFVVASEIDALLSGKASA